MKYQSQEFRFSLGQRKALNQKVIYLIESGASDRYGITREDIFNAYTGIGGLHGLKQKDFDNYHAYSQQKKEFEGGQFFTLLKLCELELNAYKVARHLYPAANLTQGDVRDYQPEVRFDCVVGNPPFHLRWCLGDGKEMVSQLYYCVKAAELLKPLGILALIVLSTPI